MMPKQKAGYSQHATLLLFAFSVIYKGHHVVELLMKIEKDTTAARFLEELGINRETVVVSKNGEIIVEEDTLKKDDEIEIIRIISGG